MVHFCSFQVVNIKSFAERGYIRLVQKATKDYVGIGLSGKMISWWLICCK